MTNEILWRYPEAEVLFDVADLGPRHGGYDPYYRWAFRVAKCEGFADKDAEEWFGLAVDTYFDLASL